MKYDSQRKKIKELYHELQNLPLPKFSSSDALAKWIEELIEIDAYYAGIALSAAEGEKIKNHELYDLNYLDKSLHSIKIENKDDNITYKKCEIYLNKLHEIDDLLNKIN